ncbi:hypothetical protein GQ54DRAFT_296740 [Martensiomyces pterosporus]|nr:hypothetical protein GQ54DRAFT_296740 [Martensiomyces pterosporus]
MKLSLILASAASFGSVALAHTHLAHLTLDGTRYGEGVCIKPYPAAKNNPVKNPASADLTCGLNNADTKAAKTCPVKAGSKITVEWRHNTDAPTDDIISASHVGPCLVYMAPLASGGKGDAWFKIFEEGYDTASKKWCTDRIRANQGKLDVNLPADIKAGDYLLRTEIIALHQAMDDYATNPSRGAQYYVNCAQVSVSGGGSASPQGYPIPGIYKTNDPGILFNHNKPFTTYPIPGPPICSSIGSSPSSGAPVPEPPTSSAPAYSQHQPTHTGAPSSHYKTKGAPKSKSGTHHPYGTKSEHPIYNTKGSHPKITPEPYYQ